MRPTSARAAGLTAEPAAARSACRFFVTWAPTGPSRVGYIHTFVQNDVDSDGADDSFGYIHTDVQNDVGSDGADDSRESRRSPSRREQDEEPFERSVKAPW